MYILILKKIMNLIKKEETATHKNKVMSVPLFYAIIFVSLSFNAVAHEEDVEEESIGIDKYLQSKSTVYITIASIIAVILVLFSIYEKDKSEKTKIFLFLGIAIPVILATLYSAGSTIYLNLVSETKGPVHWHADFEIWDCGEKVDLIDPKGMSNRVGSPVLHEHGDDRIHVEGVVVEESDVDLHIFFEFVGGILEEDYFYVPTNEGYVEISNDDLCNGNAGKLQAFLYKVVNPDETKNWAFEQQKLENFEDYILSPYANVPPGDCIIIEFDAEKEKTDKVCETYKVAMERGELSGG